MGITLGYASPAIPDLQIDDEVTSINATSISRVLRSCTIWCFVRWTFIRLFSRQTWPSHGAYVLYCALHHRLAINHDDTCNLRVCFSASDIGRFLTGVGLGFSITGVPCYVAELSPRALRGLFVGSFGLSVSSGILLIQLCGIIPGARYYWLPVVPLITLVIFVLLMGLTTKETPRWLQQTKRKRGARLVMLWLRGEDYDIDKELKGIDELVSKIKKQNILVSFKQKAVFFPVFIGCCLVSFPHISGNTAVIFYSKVIFSDVAKWS